MRARSLKGTKAQVAAEKGPGVVAGVEAHSRGPVLNPCSSHFLLVDDVHQLDGICALHVHHGPLERVFLALV